MAAAETQSVQLLLALCVPAGFVAVAALQALLRHCMVPARTARTREGTSGSPSRWLVSALGGPRTGATAPVARHSGLANVLSIAFGTVASSIVALCAPLFLPWRGRVLAVQGSQPWLGTGTQVAAFLAFLLCVVPSPLGYVRGQQLMRRRQVGTAMGTLCQLLPIPCELARLAMRVPTICGATRRLSAFLRLRVASERASSAVALVAASAAAPYRARYWWLPAVFLLRRLAFVVVGVALVQDPMLRSLAILLVAVASLTTHMAARPFRARDANSLDTIAGTAVCLSAATNATFSSITASGGVIAGEQVAILAATEAVAVAAVRVVVVAFGLRGVIRGRCEKSGRGKVGGREGVSEGASGAAHSARGARSRFVGAMGRLVRRPPESPGARVEMRSPLASAGAASGQIGGRVQAAV